jgi:hypothetical protein
VRSGGGTFSTLGAPLTRRPRAGGEPGLWGLCRGRGKNVWRWPESPLESPAFFLDTMTPPNYPRLVFAPCLV